MKSSLLRSVLVASTAVSIVACSAAVTREPFDEDNDLPDASTTRPDDNGPGSGGIGGGGASSGNGNGNGWNGDPAYYDFDNVQPCDSDVSLTGDAWEFARTLGLCKTTTGDSAEWGLISAQYANGYNRDTPPLAYQTGILPKYGNVITPREGLHIGALSTMYAREFNSASGSSADFKRASGTGVMDGSVPPAFQSAGEANDIATVRLRMRVPMNAKGLSFDFNFHSSEWPVFIGSEFNDHFVVMLTSEATPDGANIAFDPNGQPVTVNLGFFDRCQAGARTGCGLFGVGGSGTAQCPGGTSELMGTGFGVTSTGCNGESVPAGGATGWLTTRATVTPGEVITLEFMVWNAADQQLHSLALLDNFRWETNGATGIVRPD